MAWICSGVGAGGDEAGAEDGEAELALALWGGLAHGEDVDGVSGVGLGGGGGGGEEVFEAGGVEVSGEDLAEGDGAVGAGGVVHAVHGEGDGVEVSLGEDAGGVDEVLEVGASGDGFAVEVGGGAEGGEVGVEDGVALGEEACGQRRGVEPEGDRGDEGEGCREARQPDPQPVVLRRAWRKGRLGCGEAHLALRIREGGGLRGVLG
jgi:hypothetical protein